MGDVPRQSPQPEPWTAPPAPPPWTPPEDESDPAYWPPYGRGRRKRITTTRAMLTGLALLLAFCAFKVGLKLVGYLLVGAP